VGLALEVHKSLEGEMGASRRKDLSFSLIPNMFSHRCLSITTIAAIKQLLASAICLVAQRARSVASSDLFLL